MAKQLLSKDEARLVGFFALIFGIILLVTNPLDLSNFPYKLTVGSVVGIVLLFSGAFSIYYGTK